jgi:hypothetical protein
MKFTRRIAMDNHGHHAAPPSHGDAARKSQEMLVPDSRSGVRPAQMVERKVLSLLGGGQLPVSWLRSMPLRRPPA